MKKLTTSDFDYYYPERLVAQYPLERRESSRLMVVDRGSKTWQHTIFGDYLRSWKNWFQKPCLVVNNTAVIPVRLLLRDDANVVRELFIINPQSPEGPYQFLSPKLRQRYVGERFFFNDEEWLEVIDVGRQYLLSLHSSRPLLSLLDQYGHMPLPPYLKRDDEALDHERYQTVYAAAPGALAAPTAGLHFSKELYADLKSFGIDVLELTLHVGLGTFQPVRGEDPSKHQMHREWFQIPQYTKESLHRFRQEGRPIVAVGTTTLRALEAWARHGHEWETDLFIFPETPDTMYDPTVIDALITNFHQPKSTLVMLMAALLGYDLWKDVYYEAVSEHYRLFSYGDAKCLWFKDPTLFS